MFMMNFRAKLIAIPEIDFSDYGDIMNVEKLEKRGDNISEETRLSIIFNVGTKDTYDNLIDGMLYHQNKLKEIIVFFDNYERMIVYKDCTLSNMNIRLQEELSFRTLSGHDLGGQNIQNYVMDVSFDCKKSKKMKTKLYDRNKKLDKMISKLKNDK